jgi:hypothetical protein
MWVTDVSLAPWERKLKDVRRCWVSESRRQRKGSSGLRDRILVRRLATVLYLLDATAGLSTRTHSDREVGRIKWEARG